MQFTTRNSDAIRAVEVTLAFRNWRRPHAKVCDVKANVRKLKALGLTESLEVGCRLTDVGERALKATRGDV